MQIWFVMCCVWGSCELPERYHHSWKVTVDCGIVMEHSWCDHRASFPSLPLAYGFAAEEQSTSVNKYFVMCLGKKGNLEATVDIFPWAWDAQMPPAEVVDNQPLLSHEIPVHGFPWNTKTRHWWFGVCCAALLHPKGKMIKWCSSAKDWWCSGILLWQCEWCKVSSEAKLLMQIPLESHGWAALWKVGQATALPEGGKRKV